MNLLSLLIGFSFGINLVMFIGLLVEGPKFFVYLYAFLTNPPWPY